MNKLTSILREILEAYKYDSERCRDLCVQNCYLCYLAKKEEQKMSVGWKENKVEDVKNKPPQHKEVEILVKGGKMYRASWLKDANKYVRNVNSWHIVGTGNYIKDSEVIGWRDVYDSDSTDNKEKQSEDMQR